MSGISKLSSFLASIATQVRAAIEVGITFDDTLADSRRTNECKPTFGLTIAQLWDDDAPGRMTRNGLGSLEIGAGKTRIDE